MHNNKKTSQAQLILVSAMLLVSTTFQSCSSYVNATEVEKRPEIILGVNAYSFADLLSARESRDKDQVYSLFNLLDWCKSQNIKALDPTGYFFPTYPEVPSDEYLEEFRAYADSLGIAISGTGIRNHFASPDSAIRAEGVQLAKDWIVVASKLGAPVLRVFAGAIPKGYEDNWEVPAQWMIECYQQLLPTAEQYGVKLGIQNHGEMLQTAEQCLYVMSKLNSEWAGIIVDIGNFTTEDPYKDIQQLVPYAVNWQVKEFTDGYGGTIKTDYVKLIKILKNEGYSGYLPVETLKVRGDFYDPFKRVKGMMDSLSDAIDQVYNNE
ncbi:MAG: sugar phosphate isomerase/epimerase family protein [Marinoscillum sp.]